MAKLRDAISFMIVVVLFPTVGNATTHVVGGAAGWSSSVDYEAWASRNPIYLGDYLLFYYLAGYHSVLLVSKQDYDTCTTSSPIAADYSGATYVTPLTVGKTYVICGTPGLCQLGMKLEINTLGYYSSYSPPPPPYLRSPPPPAYLRSPPPPAYLQSPPPPGNLQSPPPPAYLQSPPPPAYLESPPPPAFMRSPPASNSRSPPVEKSSPPPPPPVLGSWQRNSAHTLDSVGSLAVTFALMMLAII